MSSYNKVIMMGNLTRDPEFKQLPSGQGVCRLGIATNRQFKPKSGAEAIQEVCFIDVDVWGVQAESCHKFLEKGSQVLLEGRLKLDSWQDGEGQKRSKHSIVADRITFLRAGSQSEEVSEQESSPKMTASFESQSEKQSAKKATPGKKAMNLNDDPFEDDLPF